MLAARLSEDARAAVCLVEASRDISAQSMPDAVRSRYPGRAYLDTRNIWRHLKARMSAAGEHIPTSVYYLDDIVRARPNFSLRTDLVVERILFDGRRARGRDGGA